VEGAGLFSYFQSLLLTYYRYSAEIATVKRIVARYANQNNLHQSSIGFASQARRYNFWRSGALKIPMGFGVILLGVIGFGLDGRGQLWQKH